MRYDYIEEVDKFNPYHDRRGRFTTAGNATSFTYRPGKSKAHDAAIAREKAKPYKMKTHNGIWVDAYDSVPKGWKKIKGAQTAPRGYTWYSNNKSHFSGERKQALVRDRKMSLF